MIVDCRFVMFEVAYIKHSSERSTAPHQQTASQEASFANQQSTIDDHQSKGLLAPTALLDAARNAGYNPLDA